MAITFDAKFLTLLALVQIFCFVYLLVCGTYADAQVDGGVGTVSKYYAMYQDIHVMIFVGFGLLMTFLKKHGYSSMGMTFLIGVISIQFSICIISIVHSIGDGHLPELVMDIPTLIGGDFAAGAVLISYGAVLGRVTPTQILFMTICEIVFYTFSEYVGYVQFQAVDMGGSIFVHTFGAYFGLAVSTAIGVPKNTENEGASVNSDIFAVIGTVFLWMFWPSFNGALAGENFHSQERVVINTVLSLCASCSGAFFFSHLYTGKFDMVHIQNATLAGGVAVGSSSDLVIGPFGAIITGVIAGWISTTGYVYLTPKMNKWGIYDVCGIHNLHGMPGLLGAVAGGISASLATSDVYGDNITEIFAARDTRTAGEQGGYQILAMVFTVALALIGGYLTGLAMGSSVFEEKKNLYNDLDDWLLEDEDLENNLKEMDDVNAKSPLVEEAQPLQEDDVLINPAAAV